MREYPCSLAQNKFETCSKYTPLFLHTCLAFEKVRWEKFFSRKTLIKPVKPMEKHYYGCGACCSSWRRRPCCLLAAIMRSRTVLTRKRTPPRERSDSPPPLSFRTGIPLIFSLSLACWILFLLSFQWLRSIHSFLEHFQSILFFFLPKISVETLKINLE